MSFSEKSLSRAAQLRKSCRRESLCPLPRRYDSARTVRSLQSAVAATFWLFEPPHCPPSTSQRVLSLTQKLHSEYIAARVERERLIAEREDLALRKHTLEALFSEQAGAARAEVAAIRDEHAAQVAELHELASIFKSAREALAAVHGEDLEGLAPQMVMDAVSQEVKGRLDAAVQQFTPAARAYCQYHDGDHHQ